MSTSQEYPYLCDICGKGFSEETRCDDHVRRKHVSKLASKYMRDFKKKS